MLEYWHLFLAFFIPGIVGYGGGPASIPLIEYEVVHRYSWLTTEEFSELLALGNTLPGPIATKMAGYIGFEVGGILGAGIALSATIFPSLLAMLLLLGLLYKYRNSPKVKHMTMLIRPVIGILLAVLAYQFFSTAWLQTSIFQVLFIAFFSFILLERFKVHPAFVIIGALLYGAIFLS